MTEAEDNRPEWMIELENRKRKPRLAHEAGAGSPCLSCKEACPGLDLHFWRKICKNCKCARDEHDVVDDEFPQFDLLLGPSGRPRKKATFLPVASKKQPEKVHAFDWIPPDVTTELAADYMKALPESKLPIQGSAGAALRKQQLQKQLPLHDMDHKACDKLSEHEKQQFEKYLENLKKYVGQGRVIKVIGARPFSRSLMTPANAADMQPMSPQRKPQVYSPAGESNLRTPSSFIPKVSGVSPALGSQRQQAWLAANMEAIHAQISENASSTGVRLGQYHPVLDNVSTTGQLASSESVSSNRHLAHHFANTSQLADAQQNIHSVPRNPENAQYIPDFGKVNYHQLEYSQIGEQFEPGTTLESVTPIDNPNIDSHVVSNQSSQLPHQQISSLENLQTLWNVSHGSPIQPGQYHGSNLPSTHAAETTNMRGKNLETLKYSIPGYNTRIEDEVKELHLEGSKRTGMNPSMTDELRDIGRVMQNISLSDDVPLTNAQLAEQMLSDALLPPSAVHANEIIGSTLDRNKLKYIQQKLSAKYSKDDSPSQQLLKSQRTDRIDPQYGQSIDERKNSQSQETILDKEANRAAIIAAMRNPSGLLADTQRLDKIGVEYADPLGQSGHSKRRDLLIPSTNTSDEFPKSPKANTMEYNEKYLMTPPQSQQNSTGMPLDSILPLLDAERDKLLKPNQILNRPTQYQYTDAMLSSVDPLSVIHDQQERISNADNHLPQNLDKSGTVPSHPHDDNVLGRPALASHHMPHHPTTTGPVVEQNYLENNSDIPHSERNLGNPSSALIPEQLRAELSYQPVNSHLINSESLSNPLFPEGIIDSPGLRQNPASVDQLRGALEELTVGPIQLQKCTQCKEEIHTGDVVVTAERAKDAIWHPGCFICSTCNELLVDLVYFYHKGKLYCGRDLATFLNIPRCFACDELIFVREYTVAEGHNYHVKHFCCWDCDMPLAGQQYISENDRPLCLPCYQKTYAKTCKTCNKVIAADQQGVAVKNLDFHAKDECFCCFTCKKSLLSGKMAIKENKPFCSKECITNFLSNKP